LSPVPFQVDQESRDGVLIIAVSGELDLDTAPEFEQRLREAAGSEYPVLINLTDCEFIDSTGVALIVRSWQQIDSTAGNGGNGRLVLCCPSSQVKRMLEITGVEDSIALADDVDGAIRMLNA
jgi:anti-sigma B factor antagonist